MKIQYLFFVLAMGVGQWLHGQAGDLDPTFATSGRFFLATSPPTNGGTNGVAIYPGGKTVLGAYTISSDYDVLVARLDSAGNLDNTFGTPGPGGIPQGYTTLPISQDQFTSSVVTLPSGKILLGGWTQMAGGAGGEAGDFLLMRYTADGILDPTFGFGTGYVHSDLMGHGGWDVAQGLAVDKWGNIIQVGFSFYNPPSTASANISVVKYLPNGDLDVTFNGVGMKQFSFTNLQDIATAVVVRDDGKIVIGGYVNAGSTAHSGIFAMQLLPNGNPDPSFGVGGISIFYDLAPVFVGSKFIHAMALQPDGKVVMAGNMSFPTTTDEDMLVIRLLNNGTLDPSFGTTGTGMVLIPFGYSFDRGRGVGLDSYQNILVGGYSDVVGSAMDVDWALACLRSDGTLHPGFGSGGLMTTNMLPGSTTSRDFVHALVVQPDDKIVMVGDQNQTIISAARYNGNLASAVREPSATISLQVYPNPIQQNTFRLEYILPCSGPVLIKLMDINSRAVDVLSEKIQLAGPQVEEFKLPLNTAPSVYLLQIQSACGNGFVKLVDIE